MSKLNAGITPCTRAISERLRPLVFGYWGDAALPRYLCDEGIERFGKHRLLRRGFLRFVLIRCRLKGDPFLKHSVGYADLT